MSRRNEPLELVVGDVLELRKPHPCGSLLWTVTGLGADIRLKCNGCGRRVLLPRRTLEKRVKGFAQRGPAVELAQQLMDAQPEPAIEERASSDHGGAADEPVEHGHAHE